MTKQFREDIETLLYAGVALLAGFFMSKAMKRSVPKAAARVHFTAVYHDLIPGWANMRQPCPVLRPNTETMAPYRRSCLFNQQQQWRGRKPFLQNTIMHLNDHHGWTRNEIADWLETLDHDLTFKIPEEVNR